jgi:peroxiredoxin Q/BCP
MEFRIPDGGHRGKERVMVKEGKPPPAFSLPDQNGKMHTLSDYRGSWVVLFAYPKANTSG